MRTSPEVSPRARFHRFGLLLPVVCALLLAGAILAPERVHAATHWFPVWLHLVAEVFAILVAALVFTVSWHGFWNRQPLDLLVVGCAFLAIGLLDLAHAMSYVGMPDFVTPASVEKAINFWLVSWLVLAGALFTLAFFPWRPMVGAGVRVLLLVATLGFVAVVGYFGLAHPERWPRTFVAGQGLTPFKVAMEWLVIALLLAAVFGYWRLRDREPPFDARALLTACLLSVLAGLCFTRYTQVNGLYSLLGHAFKVLAYVYIYRVVFVRCVREPYERLEAEIHHRVKAEQRMEEMAFHDHLTGLPNLALLHDRTEQALAAARRGQTHVALLFLDLDQFKVINSALGHAQGDLLLRSMARLLVEVVPTTATVSRASGDEFVILLPGLPEVDYTAVVLERLFERLEEPLQVGGQSIRAQASVGVAFSPDDGADFSTLLRNAETAMYTAKQAGRKAWRYYDPGMNAEVGDRLELSNGLRTALERGELQLFYQLQFDLFSGAVVGAEALLRWQHPQRGFIPPDRFIPIAEENGLIIPIGTWVLAEACRQAAQWRAQGLDIPVVAVNVSSIQLHDPGLEATVVQALRSSGLPPSALELELTESGLIRDSEQVRLTVERLHALGVGLSIDDFGTGYSCLAYLRRLAVDRLKIDKSFVGALNSGADGRALVTAIVQMARSLGLETVAEGVEDEATAEALRQLGCRYVQGYLYARPVPPAALQQRAASAV